MGLGAAALFAAQGSELPWAERDPSIDQAFMRRMSTHHEQGILLASIAAERVSDPHLRGLSRLMVASQARQEFSRMVGKLVQRTHADLLG